MSESYNIGILIWENAEVLDFCGPFEVFRNASKLIEEANINVFVVSKNSKSVNAQGMIIVPNYDFEGCPELDMLVIPGGNISWVINQPDYIDWVRDQFASIDTLLTVCTGALIPAKLGLIVAGMEATTHQVGITQLEKFAPQASILPDVRFTDNGKIVMSGGISAGIDSSLYVVSKLWSEKSADEIALYMEYDWQIKTPNIKDPSLTQPI